MKRVAVLSFAILMLAGPARAVLPDEQLANPKLETRAVAISRSLRCVVCQNQTIDDSDADLAHDLRVILRERLSAGDSDEQAVNYIVARYGTYVLLKPRFNAETLLLWLGPLAVLSAGGLGVALYLRQRLRAARAGATTLSPAEEAELSRIFQTTDIA